MVALKRSKTVDTYNRLQEEDFKLRVLKSFEKVVSEMRSACSTSYELYQRYGSEKSNEHIAVELKLIIEKTKLKMTTLYENIDDFLVYPFEMHYGLFEHFHDEGISILDETVSVLNQLIPEFDVKNALDAFQI